MKFSIKSIATCTIFLLFEVLANGQNLYLKTFGNPTDKAIIYLHGGPGYNCVSFEVTTATNLASKGFFVIVYDRRGEGRSMDPIAKFTFQETFDDLNSIYKKYNLKKATLIGHSFGGMVATLYTEKYPKKVRSIILVGAPVSLQTSFKNIIAKCKTIYETKNDKTNLNYISIMETMDTTSIEYSSYCFGHAMQNKFYSPKNSSDEAKLIYKKIKADSLAMKYGSLMTIQGPSGFWKNEKYTTIDLTSNLKKLVAKKTKIYGLYGKEDGLYSTAQINQLQSLLGTNNLKYLDDCSHSVFIDQQSTFIESLIAWVK